MNYPKRLIEVDLPIARISAHARREKSIRHGHISTLHIWWARRPLAACRAVILASLWPDPVDLTEWLEEAGGKEEIRAPKNEDLKPGEGVVIRPKRFLDEARSLMAKWATRHFGKASGESYDNLIKVQRDASLLEDPEFLRKVLLDFIADFANWDNSTDADYLATSRALVQAAHEALGGEIGSRPMVIDPFAGGGSIPLEALRVGADAFASDLNPIPVLLNKIVLEYIPRYGQQLADEVRKWGRRIHGQLVDELAEMYPADEDGAVPIAYVWARTILSEAPADGADPVEVPMIRSMWLAKKAGRKRALRWIRSTDGRVKTVTQTKRFFTGSCYEERQVRLPCMEVFSPSYDREVEDGTVSRGNTTCPVTGYTTPVASVRSQLCGREGGAKDSRMLAVVVSDVSGRKDYRNANETDHRVASQASPDAARSSLLKPPVSELPLMSGVFNVPIYGHDKWSSLFTPRQLAALISIGEAIRSIDDRFGGDAGLASAVKSCLACAFDRQADYGSALCRWVPAGEFVGNTFGRQALGMVWDYCEVPVTSEFTGGFSGAVEWVANVLESNILPSAGTASVEAASAAKHPLPDDSAAALVTDPPYYNAVPYADLSEFFYVWLKQIIGDVHQDLFAESESPKADEICEMAGWDSRRYPEKTGHWYEQMMGEAMRNGRRVVKPDGVGLVVFAHKSTSGWEAQLRAMIDAGWVVTGSWPIDTEMQARLRAKGSAALASSVHLVLRPREAPDGRLVDSEVGEWREILSELPRRLREWMPRLAREGVVGADAIFACLGPALEVFTRFSTVERASGATVDLREYLEHVWAAISNEALSMIFKDADAAGLEPDARLTAMWLWTIGAGSAISAVSKDGVTGQPVDPQAQSEEQADGDSPVVSAARNGFSLEYDAARKIAQGLGIHLEKSSDIVEVKGDSARLLPVSERIRHLFGKDASEESTGRGKRKKKAAQRSLFEELEAIEAEVESGGNGRFGGLDSAKPGATVLDKVHQSMVFFASGRGEALRRFLVDDGVGKDGKFWKLAQALSALYPNGTDEKRWVDGVLARKKGLGL